MFRYIVRRVLWIVPVLITISLVTWVMMKVTPGGPFDTTGGGRELPPEMVEVLERAFHLNEPEWKQYLIYMGLYPVPDNRGQLVLRGVRQGNLGPSSQFRGRTVTQILFEVPPNRPWWESRFG